MTDTKALDELSDNELIETLKVFNSEYLAARIVIWRHLGFQKRVAVACMQELSARRSAGEDFNYESYIKKELAKMPPIQTDQNHRNIITNLLKTNFKDVK